MWSFGYIVGRLYSVVLSVFSPTYRSNKGEEGRKESDDRVGEKKKSKEKSSHQGSEGKSYSFGLWVRSKITEFKKLTQNFELWLKSKVTESNKLSHIIVLYFVVGLQLIVITYGGFYFENRILSNEYRISSHGYRISNNKSEISSNEYRISDNEYEISDNENKISTHESRINDNESTLYRVIQVLKR